MKNLTKEEMMHINGGHDGTAYEVGVVVGSIVKAVMIIAFFL